MRLLLDTHTAIWFYQNAPALSSAARTNIETAENQSFVSVASLWEMSIKIGLGKLTIETGLEKFVAELVENGIQLLPVETSHIFQYRTLPLLHRDPFDRMIVAQGLAESMYIVSADGIVDEYLRGHQISRIW